MSVFGWSYPPGCSSTPYDDGDIPESCPECHGPNWDFGNDVELYQEDPAFCSKACADIHAKKIGEAEAAFDAQLERDLEDYDAFMSMEIDELYAPTQEDRNLADEAFDAEVHWDEY